MGLPAEVNMLLANSTGYNISRSLRFRNSSNANLTRTPATAGNRRTWTFSFWAKLANLGTGNRILSTYTDASNQDRVMVGDSFLFATSVAGTQYTASSNNLFRDPSAWYHFIVAVDTTQATTNNRMRLYVNGNEVSYGTQTMPPQNTQLNINNTIAHWISGYSGTSEMFGGYLAEVNFIDGQQLIPSSFGTTDGNGIWQPKKYTGTYGTNGFYLPFSNNSATLSGNLVLYSEDFTQAMYTKNNSTVSGNSTTAPNGTTTASTLTEDTANSTHRWYYNNLTYYNGISYTVSVYVKANTRTAVALENWNGSTTQMCYADLSNGTVISGSASSARVTAVGSGWYRLSVTHTGTGASGCGGALYIMNSATAGAITYTGSGSGSVYMWGSQAEINTSVGPYYYTNGTAISSTLQVGTDASTTSTFGNNWVTNNISGVVGTGRYLGSVSGSIDTSNGGPPSSMFKGYVGTPGVASSAVYPQPGVTLTWNPYASVPFTSTARVFIGVDLNGPSTGLVVNSTNFGAGGVSNNSYGWVNIASAGSPITTMSWTRASGGSQGQRVFAIEIDGVILADSPSWNPLYDSMIDSPTNYADGGNGRGNYCVMNPIIPKYNSTDASVTYSNGNLQTNGGAGTVNCNGTLGAASGKYYYECYCNGNSGSGNIIIGLNGPQGFYNLTQGLRNNATFSGTIVTGSAFSYTTGDVIGVAFDAAARTCIYYKNGVQQFTGTFSGGAEVTAWAQMNGSADSLIWNFGQQPFFYTPPTGYVALNTFNLPAATIKNGAQNFAITTYTGDGTADRIISGLSLTPDFIWIKNRSSTWDHILGNYLVVDGIGRPFTLVSSSTAAEVGGTYIGSQVTNSIKLASSAGENRTNGSGLTYVGWLWKGGGAGVTNTSGSITSTVSANPSAGFSIVTYSGNSATATVGHGLGVAPSMYIVKSRTYASGGWSVYHTSIGATGAVQLQSTSGTITSANWWNNTAPTSSVFSLAGVSAEVNTTGNTYVAYCFAAVKGYSAFGSYVGNLSTDGPMIYTGFRPRWIMLKNASGATAWIMYDTSRNTYNVTNSVLQANVPTAEVTAVDIDVLSNGFKIKTTDQAANNSGQTYVYAAFAENPFNIARAR